MKKYLLLWFSGVLFLTPSRGDGVNRSEVLEIIADHKGFAPDLAQYPPETLKKLTISGSLNNINIEYLAKCNNLEVLYLENIPSHEIGPILSALSGNTQLQELHVKGNHLNEGNALPIVSILLRNNASTLEEVNLSKDNLSDEIMKMLGDALSTLTKVKRLNLSRNKITNKGIFSLSSALENPQLERLDLSFNPISNEGAIFLLSLWKKNTPNWENSPKMLRFAGNHVQATTVTLTDPIRIEDFGSHVEF